MAVVNIMVSITERIISINVNKNKGVKKLGGNKR